MGFHNGFSYDIIYSLTTHTIKLFYYSILVLILHCKIKAIFFEEGCDLHNFIYIPLVLVNNLKAILGPISCLNANSIQSNAKFSNSLALERGPTSRTSKPISIANFLTIDFAPESSPQIKVSALYLTKF